MPGISRGRTNGRRAPEDEAEGTWANVSWTRGLLRHRKAVWGGGSWARQRDKVMVRVDRSALRVGVDVATVAPHGVTVLKGSVEEAWWRIRSYGEGKAYHGDGGEGRSMRGAG